VLRFLLGAARAATRREPASRHYFWKILEHERRQLFRVRDELAAIVGEGAADHFLAGVARRVRRPGRLFALVAVGLAGVAVLRSSSALSGVAALTVPLMLACGTLLSRSRHLVWRDRLMARPSGPLALFTKTRVRRVLRRHRRTLPARVVADHDDVSAVWEVLGEHREEVREVAERLAGEFQGTAADLLRTARALAN